ncbi:selenium-binding protein 1-like [Macadamia integrifolia]|uniref:selenium-binding protein 1-like n=1 Tax=Macadamia integrifolia TaxID=60698 RepID=UPI001C52F465|nr:selenium-binding protein 1-like [Macadamia integrifolia]
MTDGGYSKLLSDLSIHSIILLYKTNLFKVAISGEPVKVKNWILHEMPGLITECLISLDDRYLYFVDWIHGDLRQYNIKAPTKPILTGQGWIGGLLQKESSPIVAVAENGKEWQIEVPKVTENRLLGGAQMFQLSLDRKRLYITNSLFNKWDHQFYPELVENGSHMFQIDVDTEQGL